MPRKAVASGEKKSAILKKIPESEHGVGVLCNNGKYQITQCPEKNRHTLWKVVDGGFVRVATSESPNSLYAMIDWDK